MTIKYLIAAAGLAAGCHLSPLVSDTPLDGPPVPDAPGSVNILPAGTVVPSVATNPELIDQIKINEGLNFTTVMSNGGVIARSTGKAAGASVKFWNFGPTALEANGIPVLANMYVFGTLDASNVFTPLATHPPLLDTICGDVRYSAIRRVINVPVTAKYAGEVMPTLAALSDAIALGLVDTPVPAGTWVNLPVVLPGFKLEVGDPTLSPPIATTEVYAHGYLVDVFELGTSVFGRQPLKANSFFPVPVGQASSLLSGVATGSPPVQSTTPDPQPVFQFGIPTAAPTSSPNYSPIATTVTVQLASGVAPSAIQGDGDMFVRNAGGSITGYYTTNVASFTVTTTTSNMQLQFMDGAP